MTKWFVLCAVVLWALPAFALWDDNDPYWSSNNQATIYNPDTGDSQYVRRDAINTNRYNIYDNDFNSQGSVTYSPRLKTWIYTNEDN